MPPASMARILDTSPRIGSWLSLPREIRLLVLEIVAHQKHPGWASLASVCKEWQFVIATENLRKLTLDPSCLDDFGHILVQQRHLVRHIWFNIRLPEYTCEQERRWWDRESDVLVTTGITELFSILSEWKPGKGLTLDLNAYSPSDSAHWFKEFHFATDGDEVEDKNETACWHDPAHDWIHGQKVRTSSRAAILRLFGRLLHLRFGDELPYVDAVTSLVILRQLRRKLPLDSILAKLRCLQSMVYEPWRSWERVDAIREASCFCIMIGKPLPATLRRVTVFEDFDENLAEALASGNGYLGPFSGAYVERYRIAESWVSEDVALRSLDLEHLSASYFVDAEGFFDAPKRSWIWHHLETLSLTAQLFHREQDHENINELLFDVGVKALRMPKLHTMVLWNGTRGNACSFVYRVNKHFASISWRGTWDLEFSPRVVKMWQLMVSELHSLPLQTRKEMIHAEIASHGDAIHYLDLPCRVVEPASLWQIRREGALRIVYGDLQYWREYLGLYSESIE